MTNGAWVEKLANKGESTFFDPTWSRARIEYELATAFQEGKTATAEQRGQVFQYKVTSI